MALAEVLLSLLDRFKVRDLPKRNAQFTKWTPASSTLAIRLMSHVPYEAHDPQATTRLTLGCYVNLRHAIDLRVDWRKSSVPTKYQSLSGLCREGATDDALALP